MLFKNSFDNNVYKVKVLKTELRDVGSIVEFLEDCPTENGIIPKGYITYVKNSNLFKENT